MKTNMDMMSRNTQWRMLKAELLAGEHETLGIFLKPKHTVVSTAA